MARRRSRFLAARDRRRDEGDGPDPAAAMRLAVLIALLLMFVAVGAGFQGERFTGAIARALAMLGPLAEPAVFGASLLEIGAGLGVLVLIVLMIWRALRR